MNESRTYKRSGLPVIETRAGAPVLVGTAAVFGQYSQNLGGFVEMIAPEAFTDTDLDAVVALVNHDPNRLLGSVPSRTLRLSTDSVGLRYEIDLDQDDPDAQSITAKVRAGKMPGSSFSFRVAVDGDTWTVTDQGFPLRTIRGFAAVFDVGPVTFPAYRGTQAADAQTALRSLSTLTGVDIDVLAAAAAAGELRSLLPGAQPPVSATGPAVSHTAIHAQRARHLGLPVGRETARHATTPHPLTNQEVPL